MVDTSENTGNKMSEDDFVKKSNALVEAAYHPTSLYQMRLLLAAISQIREDQKITHHTEFEINAQGMADLVGISGKSGGHFHQLKKAADALVDMSVHMTEHPDGRPRAKRWSRINIVNECVYCEDEAKVILTFTPSIIPYMTELENRYKTYKLANVIRMKSMYGMRLYELCLQWIFPDGSKEVTVDEFRRLMGLEGQYSAMNNMKNRVIRPAIRDINACSNLKVTDGQRKSGRTITHFQFTITKKAADAKVTPRRGSISISKMLTDKYIEEHANPGELWPAARERLRLKLLNERKAGGVASRK